MTGKTTVAWDWVKKLIKKPPDWNPKNITPPFRVVQRISCRIEQLVSGEEVQRTPSTIPKLTPTPDPIPGVPERAGSTPKQLDRVIGTQIYFVQVKPDVRAHDPGKAGSVCTGAPRYGGLVVVVVSISWDFEVTGDMDLIKVNVIYS